MTTIAVEPLPQPYEARPINRADYLNHAYGVRSWLLTLDHKRIALLYLGSITLFFFVGGAFRRAAAPGAGDAEGGFSSPRTPTTRCSRCTAS